MGSGERRFGRRRRVGVRRRRRRGLFGRRSRVGPRRYRRRRGGYSGGGGLGMLIGQLCACCITSVASAIKGYSRTINKMKVEQDEILKEKNDRQEQNKTADPEEQEEETERIKELQEAQTELLNDMLERQAKEKNPERLQELFNQQNELTAQMRQLEMAGFKYSNEIPGIAGASQDGANNQTATTAGTDPVPEAATY